MIPKLSGGFDDNDGKWKSMLAVMFKLGFITKGDDAKGKGYGLPEWNMPA